MLVNFVDQKELAGAESPIAVFIAADEEHFFPTESDLHVGNLFRHDFLAGVKIAQDNEILARCLEKVR